MTDNLKKLAARGGAELCVVCGDSLVKSEELYKRNITSTLSRRTSPGALLQEVQVD